MSELVAHAERELAKVGEDPEIVDGVLKIVRIFSDMGHSGASAAATIALLSDLLRFKNLTPLTDSPDEWMFISEDMWGDKDGIWQNRRNSEAFSNDGGKHYYLLSEVKENGVRPLHASKGV